MPKNTQLDGLQFDQLFFPYNRIKAELDPEPRIIRGLNSFITLGGKLTKRAGTVEVEDFGSQYRADRLWIYETSEAPPKLYILASFYNIGSNTWEMFYNRPATATGWVTMGTTRALNASTVPHEMSVSQGKAYIRGVPTNAAADPYGTVIFDGSGVSPVVRLWGLPTPTTPARISGAVDILNGSITDGATTITVGDKTGFPVVFPFTVQIEYEQLSVTADAGGNAYTVTRGFNGTTAAAHDDKTVVLYRDWAASDHRVDVNYFWSYSYAWKSITGQISNRAPLETNIDFLPSNTGPFFDLKPKLTVQGHADTTNIPTIVIYRTTDGGGTYYNLEEMTNTGAGSITYVDDSLGTGPTSTDFEDPIPDELLDQGNVAPSETSNTTPPPVAAPGVIGTDDPEPGSPIVSYAGRLWYAIGSTLFYSAQEELNEGVPEESWPAGIAGNFYRIQYPIINLAATTNALYVFTVQATYVITGTNLETFNLRPLFENIGVPYGHPRAITRFGNRVAFLTHDFRVAIIEGDSDPQIVSDPLFTDLIDQLNISESMECDIKYWGDLDKEFIVVAIHDKVNPNFSRCWIYDLKLSVTIKTNFWNTKWSLRSTCLYSGRIAEDQSQRRLCWWIFDPTIPYGRFVRWDPTLRVSRDVTVNSAIAAGTEGIDFYIDTHLHLVPPGNHVNALRVPGLTPVVQYISVERTFVPGDEDPEFYYYKDDFWSDPIHALYVEDPARRSISKGYKTLQVQINEVAYRFAFRIQRANSGNIIEIQSYALIFDPDEGA